jgi:hypothetical protein
MSDVDLKVTPTGSKKVNNLTGAPSPAVVPATSAVTLAFELEQLNEQLADAAMTIAAKELQIQNLKGELAKLEELVGIADRNWQHAINETAEIRGVLKSLAAILIKWDGWVAKEQISQQDPTQVQS